MSKLNLTIEQKTGRFIGRGLLCTLFFGACVCLFFVGHNKKKTTTVLAKKGATASAFLAIEAEALALPGTTAMRVTAMARASGGRALVVAENSLTKSTQAMPKIGVLKIKTQRPLRFWLWIRAKWADGCGNSVLFAGSGQPPILLGNDGVYGVWHWVRGPQIFLDRGEHNYNLIAREDGIAVDQLLFARNRDFYPSGIVAPKRRDRDATLLPGFTHTEKVAESANSTPSIATVFLPVAPVSSPKPREQTPFYAGIGGNYRSGFESMLLRLGIPCVRLSESQLLDAATLSRFSLICLSDPVGPPTALQQSLDRYVKAGGTLVVEEVLTTPRRIRRRNWWKVPRILRQLATVTYASCRLIPDQSRFFAVLGGRPVPLAADVTCRFIPAQLAGDDIQVFGGVETTKLVNSGDSGGSSVTAGKKRYLGGALLVAKRGKGKIYYAAVPFAFHSMWRGTKLDGVLRNILLDAVGGRWRPRFADLHFDPYFGTRDLLFADDFMRVAGVPDGGWQVENGRFQVLGQSSTRSTPAFCLKAKGPGSLAAGNPKWQAYRMSGAIQVKEGTGGIWLSSRKSGRMALLLMQGGGELRLVRCHAGTQTLLARTVTRKFPGWHRLSLWYAAGAWQGWLDGQPAVRLPVAADGVGGRFGLLNRQGVCFYDDISVYPVTSLITGTDRVLGEEGSSCARPHIRPDSIEWRNVLSPLWLIRPDPHTRDHLQLRLPTFKPGELLIDQMRIAAVPVSRTPSFRIPVEIVPHTSVLYRSSGWRDYVFSGRLTEWYASDPARPWTPIPRWSCDPKWRWLGTDAKQNPAILWNKSLLRPPWGVTVLMAVNARAYYRAEWQRGRDLNLVLAGQGAGLAGAYQFRVMSAVEGCRLEKDGKLLAQSPGIGLPYGHALHHPWSEVRAVVDKSRLRLYLDGQMVIDWQTKQPIKPGQLGIWTRNNSINVARATISASF